MVPKLPLGRATEFRLSGQARIYRDGNRIVCRGGDTIALKEPPKETHPSVPPAHLVCDGWLARQRGAVEFGQWLHWEAIRAGLGQAQKHLVIGDGAAWFWKLVEARWPKAEQEL